MGFMVRATHGIVLLPVVAIYVIIICILKMKGRSYPYLFFFSIFYLYIYVLVSLTLFPMPFGEAFTGATEFNIRYNIRLIPLLTLNRMDVRTSVLNVLLTIPFGFGISFIAKMGSKKVILIGFALGLLIESLQLLQGLVAGFTFRIVDVDDVIFNFIGVMIGYGVFLIFKKIYDNSFDRLVDKSGFKHNSILLYIRNPVMPCNVSYDADFV